MIAIAEHPDAWRAAKAPGVSRSSVSARVQDHGDRLAERGDPSWDLPTPQDFVPIVPEEP